jgi:tRNA 2-selenouridine synthase
VIDLEGLANHRGSAFGGIDLPPQPTNEQFSNDLFSIVHRLNPLLPVWVEDESNSIGKVSIPSAFYIKMQDLPVYFLDVPFQERTKHLVDTYSNLNQDKLADAIGRITKRLGYDNGKFALEELANKNYSKVVEITLSYYDKSYLKGLQKRKESTVTKYEITSVNPEKTAEFLISLIHKTNE